MAVSVLTNVTNDPANSIFSCIMATAGAKGGTAIYCGFKPRHIIMQQMAGAPDPTWHSEWHDGMTKAYATLTGNTGAGTISTSAGFTVLVGDTTDPAVSFVAAASPLQAGQGFYVDTGVQTNSITYSIVATR